MHEPWRGVGIVSVFKQVGVYTYVYIGQKDIELEVGIIELFKQQYPDMGYCLYDVLVDGEEIVLIAYPTSEY